MLLDTHVWIWFHTGDPRLGPEQARAIADEAAPARLSTVSLWEAMLAMEKGRLLVALPPETIVRTWVKEGPFPLVPLDADAAIAARTLEFEHNDPADRFLAATAITLGLPLMTADAKLLALDWLPTIRV